MEWVAHPVLVWGLGLLVAFLVVCLAIKLVGRNFERLDHALDDLNRQFARGEITRAEYETRRQMLESYPLVH
jgi:uncharacterized membrane protein